MHEYCHEDDEEVRGERASLSDTGALRFCFAGVVLLFDREGGVCVYVLDDVRVFFGWSIALERGLEALMRKFIDGHEPVEKHEVEWFICSLE